MPDHFHGIVFTIDSVINNSVGDGFPVPPTNATQSVGDGFPVPHLADREMAIGAITTTGEETSPFNSAVSLAINLPNETELTLRIIDLTGQEVEKIADGKYNNGNHTFVWNADNNSSGIYFAVLRTGEKSVEQKLLLVK